MVNKNLTVKYHRLHWNIQSEQFHTVMTRSYCVGKVNTFSHAQLTHKQTLVVVKQHLCDSELVIYSEILNTTNMKQVPTKQNRMQHLEGIQVF